jgi:hypothetical protein
MAQRDDNPTISNLIGEIYQACIEPDRWSTVAEGVTKLVDGTGAGLACRIIPAEVSST